VSERAQLPRGASSVRAAHAGAIQRRRLLPMRSDLGLLILVASGPLESAVRLSNSTAFTLTKAAGLLCFTLFALDWFATRRELNADANLAILLVLLAVGLLSAVGARSEATAFGTLVRLGGFIGLYLVLTQFVGDHRLMIRFAWVLSAASALAAILAVRNFLSGTTLLAKPLYGDPNDLAYVLATTLPFALWLIRERHWRRVLAAVLGGIIVVGLALSLSRGAMLGLAAGALWYVFTHGRRARVLLLVLGVAALAVLVVVRSDESRVDVALGAKEQVAQANVESRLTSWRAALVMAQDHPLIGVGPGNFQLYYFVATGHPPGSVSYVAHNAYLEVAAELGLPALMLFVAFLGRSYHRLRQAIRWDAGPPGFASAVAAALVVAIVGAFTLSEEYYAPLWLLGGLATVLWQEGLWARKP
jgi:putative inorganic carbon (HCO3(-)) transporter